MTKFTDFMFVFRFLMNYKNMVSQTHCTSKSLITCFTWVFNLCMNCFIMNLFKVPFEILFIKIIFFTEITFDIFTFFMNPLNMNLKSYLFIITFFTRLTLGWLGLYSDVSKVGNLILFGRQIDGHDEISG